MVERPAARELPNGIRFFRAPVKKYKTVNVNVFIHQELTESLATKTALLPSVQERGFARYPDTISLRRELENLYGASLSTDVGKKGERHLIAYSLEVVAPAYLGERANGSVLMKGFNILKGLLSDPLLEDGGFKSAYVEQEKVQLANEIRGIINDKTVYSLERCVQEMCSKERFGINRLGKLADLEKIDPRGLFNYSQQLIRQNPMDIYVVGDLPDEMVESMIEEALTIPRESPIAGIPPTEVFGPPKGEVTVRIETLPVNQGKLVMGYRTNLEYRDPLYYALLLFNGILGTFPHSKLFQNVREKASLAYYVFSRLERHKGIMFIASGIEVENYQKALEIIQHQVDAMARGDITADEIENTRRGLISQLRVQEDNPNQLIAFYVDSDMGGRNHTLEEVINQIGKVTREEIVEAARKVKLDTIYFLRGEEGGVSS